MVDDTELLRRYADDKSEAAFGELVRRHLDMVYPAAVRRVGGDAHAAADVAQQVFVALAQRAPFLSSSVVVSGWLYGATRNVAADHVRKERRRKLREEEAHAMQTMNAAASDGQPWERLQPVLDRAMDELPARDREALVLRFFAQRAFAEVGRGLGISEDAARMRVDRALHRLHRVLIRHGAPGSVAGVVALLSENAVNAAPAGLHAALPASVLASAATMAGSLPGVLQLMATAKTSLAITVSALMVIGLVGYREFRATRTADAQLAAESRRVTALQVSLAGTQREIAAVQASAVTSPPSTTPAAAGERVASTSGPVAPAPTPGELKAAGDAFVSKYPEVRARLFAMRRADIAGKFGSLFQELRLTAAQIEEFEAIVGGTAEMTVNLMGMSPMLLGLDGAARGEDVKARLEQLLGPAGYQRYAEHATVDAAHVLAQKLARSLYATPTPLTATQAATLVQAITASPAPVAEGRFDWTAVVTKAGSFLSGPQLEWLRGMEAENTYRVASNVAVMTARRQQAGKATSP